VLAVAQEASRADNTPRVANAVTLEVSPEQAEKLDLARSVGSLSLVLRNPTDQADAATTGADKKELLGKMIQVNTAPVVAAVVRTLKPKVGVKPPQVEVIHGLTRSYVDI
jgi:pilus assembly protein CpaB